MNIKSEDEIKVEELNPEYDFSEQSFQDFNDDEEKQSPSKDIKYEDKFVLPENIKNEELDQKVFETGLEELKYESMSSEDQVDEKDINSEITEKSSSIEHANKFTNLKNVSSLLRKLNEKGSEVYFESDKEFFFAELVASKFPLVLLRKWSDKELKILLDDGYENGSKVLSSSRSRPQMNNKIHSMNHLHTHEEKDIFKCSECSYTCNLRGYLQFHMISTHRTKKILLDVGSENGTKVSSRSKKKNKMHSMNHLLTHEEKEIFKCSECSYTCNLRGYLQFHMISTHRTSRALKCSLCTYKCNRKIDLESHVLEHRYGKLFKCPDCNYRCKGKDIFDSHMLTHAKKLFKCSECKHESNHEENLKKHMLYHQNIKLYKCPDCAFETNHKSSLNSHHDRKHKRHVFKCSVCDYEGKNKPSLKSHMFKHSNMLFKCTKCSYETNWKSMFVKHWLSHKKKKEKPEPFNAYAFVKQKLASSGKEQN